MNHEKPKVGTYINANGEKVVFITGDSPSACGGSALLIRTMRTAILLQKLGIEPEIMNDPTPPLA